MQFDQLYLRELEERERLRGAAHLTLGFIAVLVGLLGAFLFFARGLYLVIRCYHGHEYKILPSPTISTSNSRRSVGNRSTNAW